MPGASPHSEHYPPSSPNPCLVLLCILSTTHHHLHIHARCFSAFWELPTIISKPMPGASLHSEHYPPSSPHPCMVLLCILSTTHHHLHTHAWCFSAFWALPTIISTSMPCASLHSGNYPPSSPHQCLVLLCILSTTHHHLHIHAWCFSAFWELPTIISTPMPGASLHYGNYPPSSPHPCPVLLCILSTTHHHLHIHAWCFSAFWELPTIISTPMPGASLHSEHYPPSSPHPCLVLLCILGTTHHHLHNNAWCFSALWELPTIISTPMPRASPHSEHYPPSSPHPCPVLLRILSTTHHHLHTHAWCFSAFWTLPTVIVVVMISITKFMNGSSSSNICPGIILWSGCDHRALSSRVMSSKHASYHDMWPTSATSPPYMLIGLWQTCFLPWHVTDVCYISTVHVDRVVTNMLPTMTCDRRLLHLHRTCW